MIEKIVKLLGLTVTEATDTTRTVQTEMQPQFYNVYGIAHGGFLYTLAHLTAQISAEALLGDRWEVSHASCMFLNPLRSSPAKAVAELVDRHKYSPAFRVSVYDGRGTLCFRLQAVMKQAKLPSTVTAHQPKFTDLQPIPKDKRFQYGTLYPESFFAGLMGVIIVPQADGGIDNVVDLTDTNCDDFGQVLPGVLFTAADSSVGNHMYFTEHKPPITVTGDIHYISSTVHGPISMHRRPIRSGRVLNYYDIDMVDSQGTTVATAQFVLQNKNHRKG